MQTETHAVEPATGLSGSSFYLAMRIMPPVHRRAMFEIYSFCRAVDDIADSSSPAEVRLEKLERWRQAINGIYDSPGESFAGLRNSIADFDLQRDDFMAVVDGMEMDIFDVASAPDWEMLDLYCDRVASAVGRLSVRVFEMDRVAGVDLAYHLGRALQLTNILRDIDEDAAIGRLYLPSDALDAAGIPARDPGGVLADRRIGRACALVAERASQHFMFAREIMGRQPHGNLRTPRIMAAAYSSILDRLVARGWEAPRLGIKLKRSRLFWILMCNAIN